MKLWYYFSEYGNKVENIKIVNETNKMLVTEGGYRRAKVSYYETYHRTEKEAIKYGLNELTNNLEHKKDNFNQAKLSLKEFKEKYKV